MSNTKLPALPPHPAIRDGITWRDDERKAIDEYARAAILADRERQAGEAVAGLERCEFDDECNFCHNPQGGSFTRLIHNAEDCTEAAFYICGDCAWKAVDAFTRAASLPAPQAVQAGWKQIGWTCDEGACGRIHDEPSTADPEFTQQVFVRTAAPSPDGKAEQAETPKARDLDDTDMDQITTWIGELERGDLGYHGFCDKVLSLATQPTASNAGEREAHARMIADFPALSLFHTKHALGPMTAPSCLCCGQLPKSIAIKHAELPGIVICTKCRDAALASKPPAGEPLSDSYIQTVPEKCDRIVWRGRYYHLPKEPRGDVTAQPEQVAQDDGPADCPNCDGGRFCSKRACNEPELVECPDCKGSAVPGFKRGAPCSTCDCTGRIRAARARGEGQS